VLDRQCLDAPVVFEEIDHAPICEARDTRPSNALQRLLVLQRRPEYVARFREEAKTLCSSLCACQRFMLRFV
jgi:hypothetical protein